MAIIGRRTRKGFAILEMMLIVWAATLVAYGIRRGIEAIQHPPPASERVVDPGAGLPDSVWRSDKEYPPLEAKRGTLP